MKIKNRRTHQAVVWTALLASVVVAVWLIFYSDVPPGVGSLASIGAFEVIIQAGMAFGLMKGERSWRD